MAQPKRITAPFVAHHALGSRSTRVTFDAAKPTETISSIASHATPACGAGVARRSLPTVAATTRRVAVGGRAQNIRREEGRCPTGSKA